MKYIFLFTAVALGGCATWLPAAVHEVEDNVYWLSTTGNSFASSEKMEQKLVKKAESVCDGRGFEYRSEPEQEWKSQKNYSTGMTDNYKQLEMTIECNEP